MPEKTRTVLYGPFNAWLVGMYVCMYVWHGRYLLELNKNFAQFLKLYIFFHNQNN